MASRCGPSRRLLAGLAIALAALLSAREPAFAQIERRELPVLQGASAPQPTYAPPPQPAYTPQQPAYPQQQPAYVPERPAYPPRQPSYRPQQPAFAPPEPIYPQRHPVFAPPEPIYPPQQPAYAPPQQPAYAPPQQSYAPEPSYPLQQPQDTWRRPVPQTPAPQSGTQASGPSTLPADLWRGISGAEIEQLVVQTPWPSPSPALTKLIAGALAQNAGADGDLRVKVGALVRGGRVDELTGLFGAAPLNNPGAAAVHALVLLAAGRDDEACAIDLGAGAAGAGLDEAGRRVSFLIPAYCAARSGDRGGARLALDLARDRGVDVGIAAAALAGSNGNVPTRIDVLDYLFLKLGQAGTNADIAARATPELLFLLARDRQVAPELRVAAAERAAASNIVGGATLAAAYRDAAPALAKSAQSPSALRARLFATLDGQIAPKIRAESIDALLGSGRDARIEIPMAQALAQASQDLAQGTQVATFAETGVRVAALAEDDEAAWQWTRSGGAQSRSWQLLLATADPYGQSARAALETGVDIALQSGLPGALLQRLVTVLDALGEEVPIPLWELAAKTPQPGDGYLPETGLLTSLQQSAERGEVGRTVLLAAAVLGPDGPQGAHLIGLGDSLRALKRVGLDAEARRFGFEALYAHWPQRGKV